MNRRGFLGGLAAFLAAPSVARVVSFVPIVGARVTHWAHMEMAFREYYSEFYDDIAYRDHPMLGLLVKLDTESAWNEHTERVS